MEGKRDSFVFYRSFRDAVQQIDKDDQLEVYKAIIDYALDGVEPQLSGTAKIIWTFVQPLLDANWRKYINGCKGGPHGIKGGAPKGNRNAANNPDDIFLNNPKTTAEQPQNKGQ